MIGHDIDHGVQDPEPVGIGNLAIAKRYRSEDADLLDQHLDGIFGAFERDAGWLEDVPVVAPY